MRLVQCDICGEIDAWKCVENAPHWEDCEYQEGDMWTHGANPDEHYCPHCTEILRDLNGKKTPSSFYSIVVEDEAAQE